jgi:hypothetical protein
MSIPRLSIREYVEASEILLKLDDLTDAEMEAVQEILDRLSEKLNSGHDSKP